MTKQKKDLVKFGRKLLLCLILFLTTDTLPSALFMGKMVPFSNYNLLNFKLYELAYSKEKHKNVLSFGSSLTLVNIHSRTITDQLDKSFYNCAIHGMKIKESFAMIKTVCPIYKPKIVLVSSGYIDFRKENNSSSIPSVMKMKSYMRFPYLFYGSIPLLIKKNSLNTYEIFQTEIMENHGTAEELKTDAFGGINISISSANKVIDKEELAELENRGTLNYADSEGYDYLEQIAKYLNRKNIQFVFVQSPTIKSEYSSIKKGINDHISKCRNIVESNGGFFINGYEMSDSMIDNVDFYDTGHMNSCGAQKYTEFIVKKIREQGLANAL